MKHIENLANQWQNLSIQDKKAVKQSITKEERSILQTKLK